ncbi:hypothetical protein CDL15_Pgr006399 [Punica granatum]|uniref:Uncharacterized protein n=1 Tax=Punica granatum TaxID=22663 RepID=A0A218VUT0_PUNGR|nr:hypothetical protein CDL15_Pgr006399 [Punica granatum]
MSVFLFEVSSILFQLRSIGFLELSRVSIYSYGFISLFGHQLRFQLAKHHPHPRLGILQQARYTVHGSHSGLSSSSRPSQPQLEALGSPLSSYDTPASQKSSSSRSLTMATNIAMVLLHMPVMEVTLPILLGVRFVDGSSLA